MKRTYEKITPEHWALQHPEFSWNEGMEAFLKRRCPSPGDLVIETRTPNAFERFFADVAIAAFLVSGPLLMVASIVLFLMAIV